MMSAIASKPSDAVLSSKDNNKTDLKPWFLHKNSEGMHCFVYFAEYFGA